MKPLGGGGADNILERITVELICLRLNFLLHPAISSPLFCLLKQK